MAKQRALLSASTLMIGSVVVLALVAATAAVWSLRPHGELGSGLPEAFSYRVEDYTSVPAELLRWREIVSFPIDLAQPRSLAVGTKDDVFYVAGDRAVRSFGPRGEPLARIDLDATPRCLALATEDHAAPGRLYIVFSRHVEVYRDDGTREASWPAFDAKAALAGIALSENDVFLADAGRRIVLRCDVNGAVRGEIGRRDQQRGVLGFVIPSGYFDLAMGADGLLRVVNPGRHRIEYYTPEGQLEQPLIWGKAGIAIDAFCGCCNPANIALLSDGRTVTAEKGILRVKVYTEHGDLQSIVAGPNDLLPSPSVIGETRTDYRRRAPLVAVDRRQRVVILDPAVGVIRVFEEVQ